MYVARIVFLDRKIIHWDIYDQQLPAPKISLSEFPPSTVKLIRLVQGKETAENPRITTTSRTFLTRDACRDWIASYPVHLACPRAKRPRAFTIA